jgi:hypothetical protein
VNIDNVTFRRLDAEEERPDFDCGDSDLNEFFFKDSSEGILIVSNSLIFSNNC